MRDAKPGLMLCAIILTCVGFIESARAQDVLVTWSQGGWAGGGEVTGSFVINDNVATQTGFLGVGDLVSFQAQWSGNIYSQPYAWTLAEIQSGGSQITWYAPGNALDDMQIDYAGGHVEYEPFNGAPIVEDYRSGALDPPGFGIPQYTGISGSFSSSIVVLPEPAISQMLLGLALPVLLLRRWRRFCRQNRA